MRCQLWNIAHFLSPISHVPIIKATQSAEWTTDQGANKKQYYGNTPTPTVRDQLVFSKGF